MEEEEPGQLKRAVIDATSGLISGAISRTVTSPLDVIKIRFQVDMSALSQMGDQDLKELGIPMGPRKKILLALLARSGRQAR